MRKTQQNWTEDQLLKVIALYHQLPFGRLHQRNPAVVKLASVIGRTPSAVALKLVNFASFDPTLKARGITGMGNASRLDREVWNKHAHQWEELANATPEPVAQAIAATEELPKTEVERLQRSRLGQGFFRNSVLSAYNFKCCITNIAEPALLRASHIIPWSASETNRLNPANGLCLNALHDSAFDRGLLTLDRSFRLIVSPKLAGAMPKQMHDYFFAGFEGKAINLPERSQPDLSFLEYHRKSVFKG